MSVIVTILFVLNAVLLIGVVLIQQPKTAGGLFSGTGQSLLGTSGKTFWTKFTTILAGTFMVLCLLMSIVHRFEKAPSSVTDIIEKQQQQAASPAQAAVTNSNPSAANPQPQVNPAPQGQAVPKTVPSSPGDLKK
jgi:preprotein translocase subunit SecG